MPPEKRPGSRSIDTLTPGSRGPQPAPDEQDGDEQDGDE